MTISQYVSGGTKAAWALPGSACGGNTSIQLPMGIGAFNQPYGGLSANARTDSYVGRNRHTGTGGAVSSQQPAGRRGKREHK